MATKKTGQASIPPIDVRRAIIVLAGERRHVMEALVACGVKKE